MATSIQVNKKSISELLKTGGKNKFVVPEYQRSYAWEEEQCQTLWDDIVYFSEQKKEDSYFLGTIVSYQNEKGEQEIIDGQQRITTLFLLLRAIYKKLESMNDNDQVQWLIHQISPCIWDIEGMPPMVKDYSKVHIKSLVIRDENNQIFFDILERGDTGGQSKDRYSLNYRFFQSSIDDYCKNNALNFYNLCDKILENCILLPIECDNQDTALTIFSTLNDRGLPLSDADIFKAKIYNHIGNDEEKNKFIEQWQELDSNTQRADIRVQDLFYYYMFYLRANEGDKETTTPGLRKYFARDKFKKLYEFDLIDDLKKIAELWTIINRREEKEDWSKKIRIKQAFSCLKNYPNEFWKYPITIYYLKYRQELNFGEIFANFLENLLAVLCASYVVEPTVNAIKSKIMNLNLEILETQQPKFFIEQNKREEFERKLENPHRSIVRMILEICAYKKQSDLLPLKCEIEHILPKKRQNTNLYGYHENDVKGVLEEIGNKTIFEKKLNIEAGNKYFNRKKEEYRQSNIMLTKELSNLHQEDRAPEDIQKRTKEIASNILEWFDGWRAFGSENHIIAVTDEDLKLIQKGENTNIEFKSSMRRSYQAQPPQIDKSLEYQILKTVAAFLNTDGGTLFIGVEDNGTIIGLEKDFQYLKNADGFSKHITNLINNCFSKDMHHEIKVQMKTIEEKEIAVIKVDQSKSYTMLKYKGNDEFYIRTTAGSIKLEGSEMIEYINKKDRGK